MVSPVTFLYVHDKHFGSAPHSLPHASALPIFGTFRRSLPWYSVSRKIVFGVVVVVSVGSLPTPMWLLEDTMSALFTICKWVVHSTTYLHDIGQHTVPDLHKNCQMSCSTACRGMMQVCCVLSQLKQTLYPPRIPAVYSRPCTPGRKINLAVAEFPLGHIWFGGRPRLFYDDC